MTFSGISVDHELNPIGGHQRDAAITGRALGRSAAEQVTLRREEVRDILQIRRLEFETNLPPPTRWIAYSRVIDENVAGTFSTPAITLSPQYSVCGSGYCTTKFH